MRVKTNPPDSNRCDTSQVPRALSNSREEQCACAWHHLCAISDELINTCDTATWSVTFLVLLVPVIGLGVLSGPSAVSIYLSFLSVMDLCVCAVAVGTRQGLAAAATAAGSPCVAVAAAAAGGVAVAATTIRAGRCVQHTLASDRAFVSLNTIRTRRGLHAFTTRPSPAETPTSVATTRKRTGSDSCGSRTSKRLSNGASAEEESECADYPSSTLQNLDSLEPFMMLRVARKCAPSWDGGDVVVTNKGVRTDRHTTCRYITVKKPGDNREYHVIDDPDEKPTPAEHGAVVVPHRPVSAKSRSAGGQSAAAAAAQQPVGVFKSENKLINMAGSMLVTIMNMRDQILRNQVRVTVAVILHQTVTLMKTALKAQTVCNQRRTGNTPTLTL